MPGSTYYLYASYLCGGRERNVYYLLYPLGDTIGSTWLSLDKPL